MNEDETQKNEINYDAFTAGCDICFFPVEPVVAHLLHMSFNCC